MTDKLKRKEYAALVSGLQAELATLLHWIQTTAARVVILFEGRDTAGKGGAINIFTDCLNPRACRVVALPKPTERERSQWYFQRYVEHLPAAGELVLFDRSWYNRAGVEHVLGFCTDTEYRRFLEQCPAFERMLTDDGVILLKYWFSVDQAEQEKRFAERLEDPIKRWKLSPVDIASRERYADYTRAREEMFAATHTQNAPWAMVDCNEQKRGRLNMVADVLARLPELPIGKPIGEIPPLPGKPLSEQSSARVDFVKARY